MRVQEYYDSAMQQGTKTKALGVSLGGMGAFLALGAAGLTAGMTLAAAAPVLALGGGVGLASAIAGKILYREGVEHQDWINNAYSKNIEAGTIQKKTGLLSKIGNIREKYFGSSVDNQHKNTM